MVERERERDEYKANTIYVTIKIAYKIYKKKLYINLIKTSAHFE